MDEVEPDSAETSRLLEQVESGNREAFERLFTRHRDSLRRFVELRLDRRLRARADVSDVVQETQMEAFRRLADYLERRPMPFRLWLCKTAHERFLMLRRQHLKAARRSIQREVVIPDRSSLLLAQRLLAGGSAPGRGLERRELADRVRQALAQLAAADREVLFMWVFEEMSYQEIACILDIEPATARKLHGRALLRLHRALSDLGERGA